MPATINMNSLSYLLCTALPCLLYRLSCIRSISQPVIAMGLTKQAKTLTGRRRPAYLQPTSDRPDTRTEPSHPPALRQSRPPRTKRSPSLTWGMLTDAEGNLGAAIHLRNEATKGRIGTRDPPSTERLRRMRCRNSSKRAAPAPPSSHLNRCAKTTAAVIVNLFAGWYRTLGFQGCSGLAGEHSSPAPLEKSQP